MKYSRKKLDELRSDFTYYEVFFREILKTPLVKTGDSYVAICCLHTETTASLKVYKSGNLWFYKCFGCGHKGDIFKLVIDTKSFPESQPSNYFEASEAYVFRKAVEYVGNNYNIYPF